MSTQTIDFNNVNEVKFNNQNVNEVVLNNQTIWPMKTPYIKFESPSGFTLNTNNLSKNWDGTLEFSTDKFTWTAWNGSLINSSNDGQLYLRGTNNTYLGGVQTTRWEFNGSNISISGNIENLLNYNTVKLGNHPPIAQNCFQRLFQYASAITNIDNLILGTDTLSNYCYDRMFWASGITSIPGSLLPATTLADYCYNNMFYNCTSLGEIQSGLLSSSSTMKPYCYSYMFGGCTSLTKVPQDLLISMTLANYCYSSMFYNCSSLQNPPSLPATTLADGCYYQMFRYCSNLDKLIALPATGRLPASCYQFMFCDCSAITIRQIQQSGDNVYRVPISGTASTTNISCTEHMLPDYSNLTINTDYYTPNSIIYPS